MNRILVALSLVAALSIPVQALADCREIVAATVAELRAGSAQWNDEMERVARAAAGSACVKAGGSTVDLQRRDAAISEESVPANDQQAGAQATASEAAAESDDDEDWHPLKGFKFNKVTGSPGKKPYERRREVNETEAEREDQEE